MVKVITFFPPEGQVGSMIDWARKGTRNLIEIPYWNFSGGPGANMPHSQCRFNHWSDN